MYQNQMLLRRIEEINNNKRPTTTFQVKDIKKRKKNSKSLNTTMRINKDKERIRENRRFVDKLVHIKPVISTNKLKKEYNKQRYFKNQISKNSNKYYHNKFFYENFDKKLSPFLWEDKSDIESVYLNNSPLKDTMSSSINYDNDYTQETRNFYTHKQSRRIRSGKNYAIRLRSGKAKTRGAKSRLSRRNNKIKIGYQKKFRRPFSAINN